MGRAGQPVHVWPLSVACAAPVPTGPLRNGRTVLDAKPAVWRLRPGYAHSLDERRDTLAHFDDGTVNGAVLPAPQQQRIASAAMRLTPEGKLQTGG